MQDAQKLLANVLKEDLSEHLKTRAYTMIQEIIQKEVKERVRVQVSHSLSWSYLHSSSLLHSWRSRYLTNCVSKSRHTNVKFWKSKPASIIREWSHDTLNSTPAYMIVLILQ